MCRYATSGHSGRQFVCFSCQKAFQQPSLADFLAARGLGYLYEELVRFTSKRGLSQREKHFGVTLIDLYDEYSEALHKCPECGQTMIDVGLDFKAPSEGDEEGWETLQGRHRSGHAFETCGCHGPGWIPKSESDYRLYLESRQREYLDQLEQTQQSDDLPASQKREAADCWDSRLQAVASELSELADLARGG